jgi:hypothetical protein
LSLLLRHRSAVHDPGFKALYNSPPDPLKFRNSTKSIC